MAALCPARGQAPARRGREERPHGPLWCMDQSCGRTAPYPDPGSYGAYILRATELQHAVQYIGGNRHLGLPAPVRMRAQCIADYPLETRDVGFDQRPAVIAGGLLPAHAAALSDASQVTITPCR